MRLAQLIRKCAEVQAEATLALEFATAGFSTSTCYKDIGVAIGRLYAVAGTMVAAGDLREMEIESTGRNDVT